MIFSAKHLKDMSKVQQHQLYQIEEDNNEFTIEEKGSNHRINIKFNFAGEEYGLFGREYRSDNINKRCPDIGKAVDLLCMVIDEETQKTVTYLYDVKESFDGSDVIEKGLKQIAASVNHSDSLLVYCRQFDNQRKVGIITGRFQKSKIEDYISKKRTELDEYRSDEGKLPPMVYLKVGIDSEIPIKKRIEMMENVLDRKIKICNEIIDLDIRVSDMVGDTYVCDMEICI